MRSFIYSLIFIFLFIPLITSATTIPVFPMAFWGTVTLNGSSAPVGTVVRAYYGSVLAGIATVQESGIYGYTEPTKQKLIVGEGNGSITFTVQSTSFNSGLETVGNSTISYNMFTSGLTVQKNLDFIITVPSVVITSSGGSGGGGGTTIAQTATVKKGDANNDNKVDIFDFNSLLIQWGKTGSSNATDFDKNGVVDIFDFNLLLINWTK